LIFIHWNFLLFTVFSVIAVLVLKFRILSSFHKLLFRHPTAFEIFDLVIKIYLLFGICLCQYQTTIFSSSPSFGI